MAETKPVLIRFPEPVLERLDEHVASLSGASRNAVVVDLVVRGLAGHGASSGVESSGPGSYAGESEGSSAPEGASQADPGGGRVGTEAPSHCEHGVARGFFCYRCQGRVPD